MKRLLAFILVVALLVPVLGAQAAGNKKNNKKNTDAEAFLVEDDEEEYQDPVVYGEVYPEKNREDFDLHSPAIYKGKLSKDYSIYADRSNESKRLYNAKKVKDIKVDILYVGLKWMIVRKDKVIGYVKREGMVKSSIKAADDSVILPFNAQKHNYIAKTATKCHVRKSMIKARTEKDDGNNYVILEPDTEISIWIFYKGWALVNYQRDYGYIDPNELKDIIPVSPSDDELYPDSPIAAYTSYYNMADTEKNNNRIHNIRTGCGYISKVLQPGEKFDANDVMGPYSARNGYKQAGVLTDGEAALGYGGGTCQVSSTLYNVLIQLPGIEIIHRRPHGASGASYLPIHCDAAVGNQELNLIFKNNYAFPIRIVATSHDDGALLVKIYVAHELSE